jgi:putative CocE/NonD family hydrolase
MMKALTLKTEIVPVPLHRLLAALFFVFSLAACNQSDTAVVDAAPAAADKAQSDEASGAEEVQENAVKAGYNKTEHMIPMRDGVNLYTAIYTPLDTSKTYPFLLYRTPYSVRDYGADVYPQPDAMAPSEAFLDDGYIIVKQDIRGTYQSEGEFMVMRPPRADDAPVTATDESTDTYDTIEWILENVPGHNGRVGQWGVSYMGWTTLMGMIDPHPALKASSPQASPSDMFIGDDWHHNGAFRLMYAFYWMSLAAQKRDGPTEVRPEPFDFGTPWGYQFHLNTEGTTGGLNQRYFEGRLSMWEEFADHPNYDEYWRVQNFLQYLDGIKHPVLNVAGWFDAEDFYGPISIYQTIEEKNPENQSSLVVGPWLHGGWVRMDGSYLGDIDFGSKTSEYFKEEIVLPFFQYHLKDQGDWKPDEAIVFETGGNRWHRFNDWPPAQTELMNLYLREGRKLSFDPPPANTESVEDRYISDPAKPVPYTTEITLEPGHTWMIEDQRLMSTRPDVLVYQTDVLTEDITIAGPILANLVVSSTGTDSDFFVKLIDVYPGDAPDPDPNPKNVRMGHYQMLVGVEAMRAKFRNSFSDPEPMLPGSETQLSFNIWDKMHTFKKGHRIMVHIHSTWFPAYDRNPQQFMDIYRAEKGDYMKATQTVHRSQNAASHLVLPVLRGLPPVADAITDKADEPGR